MNTEPLPRAVPMPPFLPEPRTPVDQRAYFAGLILHATMTAGGMQLNEFTLPHIMPQLWKLADVMVAAGKQEGV